MCAKNFSCVKGTKCCCTNRNATSILLKTQNAGFKHTWSIFSITPPDMSDSCFSSAPSDLPRRPIHGRKGQERESPEHPRLPLSLAAQMHLTEETIYCLNLAQGWFYSLVYLPWLAQEWKLSQHQMYTQRLNEDQSSLPLDYNPGNRFWRKFN